MILTLSLAGFLMLAVVFFARASPLTGSISVVAWLIGALAFLVALVAGGIARATRDTSKPPPSVLPTAWGRVAITLLAGFVLEQLIVTILPRRIPNFWVVESSYFIVLVFLGIALARWARSPGYIASLGALFLVAAPALVYTIRFMTSAAVRFQYGPETLLFAIAHDVKVMVLSPLDVAVTWSAWKLASVARRPIDGKATVPGSR